MATLSAPELVKLREKQHKSTLYLSVLKPETIVAARVNEPGGIDRGAREFDFDGGTGTAAQFARVGAYQTLWVGTSAGARDKGKVRIKSITGNQVSGAIYFDENSVDWNDNDYISVLENYEIWPILPRIAGGIFYKFYDTVYSDQNTNVNPVAIMGPHRAFWLVDTDENDTIAVNADDGYIIDTGTFLPNNNEIRFGVFVPAISNYKAWFRFATVDVPQGAKVISAFIRFTADGNQTSTFNLKVTGERSANPAAISGVADYVGRVQTSAKTDWDGSDIWIDGQTYDSPDISTVIQEVIDQAGFVSGNAIQLFVEPDDGTGSYRQVRAKDSGSGQATLYVTYERVDITIDGSDSYAVANGAAISSYAWDASQGTFANAAVASTTLTIVQPGYTWVELEVTDDNAKTQKTWRCYFTHDSDNPPVKDFTITSLSGDWSSSGWSLSIDVHAEDATLADFPDGTLVVLWYKNYIDGSEDYVNVWDKANEVVLAGYIERDTDADMLATGSGTTPDNIISFNIVTPDSIMARKTEMGTVSIEAVASPDVWYQYASWLTCGRAIHHLLKWHSTILETCDVLGLITNTLGVYVAEFTEDSLLQQCNSFAYDRGIFAKLVSDHLGRLHLDEDPQLFNTADRAARDTVFSLTTADLSGEVNLAREPIFTNAMSFLDGFSFDGTTSTPLIAIAPGYLDGADTIQVPEIEGSGTVSKPRQILADQTDANEKVGRILAAANNPNRELRITLRGNYLGAFDITPYSLGWYGWSVADATLARQIELNSTKWLCRRVELQQVASEFFAGEIETRVVLEGESFAAIDGLPGEYPTSYPTGTATTPPNGNGGNGNGGGAAVSGYFIGGQDVASNPSAVADKVTFSTGATAAQASANLSAARYWLGSSSDKSTYGYFAGGNDNVTTRLATADRLTFATDTTAANAGSNLSAARDGLSGQSDGSTYGYFGGGVEGTLVAKTDRITFATGITAANAPSNLSAARQLTTTVSDGTGYGYWCGGTSQFFGLGVPQNIVDRINFATGATALHTTLSSSRSQPGGHSDNSTYGYVIGGDDNAGTTGVIADRVVFSTSVFAANAGSNLPVGNPRSGQGTCSDGANYGYLAGGANGGVSVNTYRTSYSTEATAANAASNISVARGRLAGLADGAI